MAVAQRDANFVTVGMGVSSVDGVTPLPILVDVVTGRLLVEIAIVTDVVGTLPSAPAARDANHVTVGLASDGSGNPLPLMIDHRNNFLYLDVLVEP